MTLKLERSSQIHAIIHVNDFDLQAAFGSCIALAVSAAVIAVQLLHEQPDGECTDHVSTWLWVYMGAMLVSTAINIILAVSSSGRDLSEGPSAAQSAFTCCQGTVGLFAFAWWVTGIVWYTQAEDAGCTKEGMDLMLAVIILPGVMLALGCCLACAMGGALMASSMGGRGGLATSIVARDQQQPEYGASTDGDDGVGEWGAGAQQGSPAKAASSV